MFTIDTTDGMTGGVAAPAAPLAALRRILTPERILLCMVQARGAFASIALPEGVAVKPSSYSGTFWAEATCPELMAARAATLAASGGGPLEADTLPLRSMHWQMVWSQRMPDGVTLEYRLTVRLAPKYSPNFRPDAGAMSLTGELTQCPELPGGIAESALAPKYRAASLNFRATPKA